MGYFIRRPVDDSRRHNCGGRATVLPEMSTSPERRPSVLKAFAHAALYLIVAGAAIFVLALVGLGLLVWLFPMTD